MLCACGATQGVGGGESRRSQTTALARHAGSRVGPHRVRQEYFGPLGRVAVGEGAFPRDLVSLSWVRQQQQISPYFNPTYTRTGWIGQPPVLDRHEVVTIDGDVVTLRQATP